MSSVQVCLYDVTKVLSQIWGAFFCPPPSRPGVRGPFLRLYCTVWRSSV